MTRHLRAPRAGDPAAFDALYTRLYDELRRLARRVRAGRACATLSTTALVHEAYLKLDPSAKLSGDQHADFFAVAAWAMRSVLVDGARRKQAGKRGGGFTPVTLGDDAAGPVRSDELLALDEALERLRTLDERRAGRRLSVLRRPDDARDRRHPPLGLCHDWCTIPRASNVKADCSPVRERPTRSAPSTPAQETLRAVPHYPGPHSRNVSER